MNNKIQNAFKGGKAFIPFVVAGDPSIDATADCIVAMAEAGADIVEIGIPFSDPVADGPVIQAANIRALEKGVSVRNVFELVKQIRVKSTVPLVLLTYLNPVYFFGYEDFFTECKSVGIDGIIIPDLPFEEQNEVADVAAKYSVDLISLITPASGDRVAMIAEKAKGFLYFVSSMGTTGVRDEIKTNINAVIESVRKVSDIPVAIGFGISRTEQAAELSKYADGIIVGSAIVELIQKHGESATTHVHDYVKTMKSVL